MLGQGTVGLEFEQQYTGVDTFLVAVGGGGLLGGVAAWFGGSMKLVGVEPEAAPTLTSALQAGKPVDSEAGGIAADSLAPKRVGELTFPTTPSSRPRSRSGVCCELPANRVEPPPWPRYCRTGISRNGENASVCWFAAATLPQSISQSSKGAPMSVYDRLSSLNISLPQAGPPAGAYVPFVRTGNLVFSSGHVAKRDGKPWIGQLGVDLTTHEGKQAARSVAVDLMGTLHSALGDLNQIKRIVKLMVLVNSAPNFTEQHLVANGASELFQEVFGDQGRHARSAFGVAQIPFGSCVEIDLIAEVSHE
jgi:enamine deaminase RidA (YjgF/YER057c/UK114 family)